MSKRSVNSEHVELSSEKLLPSSGSMFAKLILAMRLMQDAPDCKPVMPSVSSKEGTELLSEQLLPSCSDAPTCGQETAGASHAECPSEVWSLCRRCC